jgi:hypothetical protein
MMTTVGLLCYANEAARGIGYSGMNMPRWFCSRQNGFGAKADRRREKSRRSGWKYSCFEVNYRGFEQGYCCSGENKGSGY